MVFSKEEMEAIKIDCFHILKSVDLSEENKKIRESIIEKVENRKTNNSIKYIIFNGNDDKTIVYYG